MLQISTLYDTRKLIHAHFASKGSGVEITYYFETALQVQEKEEEEKMGLEISVFCLFMVRVQRISSSILDITNSNYCQLISQL